MFREGSTFTGQIFSIFKIKIIALTIPPLRKVSDHTLHCYFLLWLCCGPRRLLAPWTHWTFSHLEVWNMLCHVSSLPYPHRSLPTHLHLCSNDPCIMWPSLGPLHLFVHFFHILQCLTHNKFTKIELYEEHFVQMRPISFMSY